MRNRTFKSYLHVWFQCAITTTYQQLYSICMLFQCYGTCKKQLLMLNNWLKESIFVQMSHLLKRIMNSMLKVAHIKINFFISQLLKNDSHLICNFHAQHLCWNLLLLGLSSSLGPSVSIPFLGFIIDRILFLFLSLHLLLSRTSWKIIL